MLAKKGEKHQIAENPIETIPNSISFVIFFELAGLDKSSNVRFDSSYATDVLLYLNRFTQSR
jgi:hypothetical protein